MRRLRVEGFGTFEVVWFGQLISYRREFDDLVAHAKRTGAASDPLLRDRIARAWLGLEVLRSYALATVAGGEHPEADSSANPSVIKILWSRWHKALGELAMEVRGAAAMVAKAAPYDLDGWQRLYLFSRADTIYGGSDEIQLGIIAGRALGLLPSGGSGGSSPRVSKSRAS